MQLVIARKVGTTETALRTATVAGITQTADTSYRVAFRAVTSGGTTTLSAKLWRVGTTEPSAWTATVTDATAGLQSGGSVGVNSYMSSSAAAAGDHAGRRLRGGRPGLIGARGRTVRRSRAAP